MSSTILVADSDASICTLVRDILAGCGYRVEIATGFDEAASIAVAQGPDLIFMSLGLDGRNGVELVEMAARGGAPAPLILMVDAAHGDPVKAVRENGAFSYLKKPIDRSRLEMSAGQGVSVKDHMARADGYAAEADRMKELLHAALDGGDEACFILDARFDILECGGRTAELAGVSGTLPVGQSYLSILSDSSAELHAAAFDEARDSGKAVRLEEAQGRLVRETVIMPVSGGRAMAGFIVRMLDVTACQTGGDGLARSEKQYRSVFESASDAIVLIDMESGNVINANAAATRSLGYDHAELCALPVENVVVHPEQIRKAMERRAERISYESMCRKNGTSFPVELSLRYFANGGRDICALYVEDISKRRVVEEALREGARLYRAVVEDQTELICRYNTDGILTFVNGAYARFFDEDEDNLIGSDCFSVIGSLDRRVLAEWLSKAGAADSVFDQQVQQVRHDGEVRWIHWTNRAVLNERRAVTEIQAVGRDVTERKEAERALNEARQEKEQYRLNLVATFKSIPDAILTVDNDLTVMASNSAAASLFAYDKGRMRGLPLDDVVSGEGNPCVGVLKQVLRTFKPVRGYEIELETPTMGERMVEINCSPLIDQDKRHTGAVLVVRDVSHIADLEKQLQKRSGFRGIVGSSPAMQGMYELLEQLSSLESIVLILGESGTGKELVAEALHYGGVRAGKPLIKVNCSALSESLLESELFGHVKGAFTGAVRDKVGRIQAAQGGTLFLDEIGDISPLLQLKLLRFLEQKEYERVGDTKTQTADVRIIAATNVDMLEAVRQGTFREDLYYRLNVMPVTLPALRERQGDIPLLVDHFLGIFAEQFGKSFDGVSDEVMDLFMGYAWPGNVRELRHALEHACILSPGKVLQLKHIRKDLIEQAQMPVAPAQPYAAPAYQPQGYQPQGYQPQPYPGQAHPAPAFAHQVPEQPGAQQYHVPPRKPGKEDILAALAQCGGNKVRAARQLGIHRATLYRKLKAWGVEA